MQHQLITLASIGGKGTRPAYLEWHLSNLNVVETHMEEPPPPPQFKITTHTSKAGSRFRGVGGAREEADEDRGAGRVEHAEDDYEDDLEEYQNGR